MDKIYLFTTESMIGKTRLHKNVLFAVVFIRGKSKKKSLLNESPSVKDIKFLGQSTVFSWSYSLKQNEIIACQIE